DEFMPWVVVVCSARGSGSFRCRAAIQRSAVQRHAVARHWAVSRRACAGGYRGGRQSVYLLFWWRFGRCVAHERRRSELAADLRQKRHLVDWRNRRIGIESQRHLCGDGRIVPAWKHLLWRWHVQDDRRGQDLDAYWPQGYAAHRAALD